MRRGIGYSKSQIADALNVRYESRLCENASVLSELG